MSERSALAGVKDMKFAPAKKEIFHEFMENG